MARLWTFGDSFTAGHGCTYNTNGSALNPNTNDYYTRTYKDYIDINRKIWVDIVSNHFNLELKNMAKNGMSTESIADSSLKHLPEIESDDVVILQTSTIGRFDFPFLKEKTLFGYAFKRDMELFNTPDSPYFFKTIFITNIQKEYSEDVSGVLKYTNAQESFTNTNVILNKHKYNTIRGIFSEFITTGKYYERYVWRIVQISNILKSIGIKNYIINEDIWPQHLVKPNNLIEMHDYGISGYINTNRKTIYHKTNTAIDDFHPSYEGHDDIASFIINFIENETTNIHNA